MSALIVLMCSVFYVLWPDPEIWVTAKERKQNRTGILLLVTPITLRFETKIKNLRGEKLDKYRDTLDRLLVAAGSPAGLTTNEFIVLQVLMGIAAVVIGAAVFFTVPKMAAVMTNPFVAPFIVLVLFAGGAFLGLSGLRDRMLARHRDIFRALPFFLDMVTISVEAGMTFGAALRMVVNRHDKGPLAEELRIVLSDVALNKPVASALRDMAERVRFFHLSTIIAPIIQGQDLGVPLAAILRDQADDLRKKRRFLADEKALKAPVKLLFPLIAFIFPCVFIMLFGPIALTIGPMIANMF